MNLSSFKQLCETIKTQQPDKFQSKTEFRGLMNYKGAPGESIADSGLIPGGCQTRSNEFNQLDVPIYMNTPNPGTPHNFVYIGTEISSNEMRSKRSCNYTNHARPFAIFNDSIPNPYSPCRVKSLVSIRPDSTRVRDSDVNK
jgi:hypothetical protein